MGEALGDPVGTTSDDERMRILELLEQRKITASEAADLLNALDELESPRRREAQGAAAPFARGRGRARWIRIRVTDVSSGRVRTNVSLPIVMVGFGLAPFARRFRVPGLHHMADDLLEAVREGRRGTIFDVANEGGERIEIVID